MIVKHEWRSSTEMLRANLATAAEDAKKWAEEQGITDPGLVRAYEAGILTSVAGGALDLAERLLSAMEADEEHGAGGPYAEERGSWDEELGLRAPGTY